MEKRNLSELNDEQLSVEKRKLKRSKTLYAILIGFLVGIVIFGLIASIISKRFVIIIPLLFPLYFIYRLLSNSKTNNELEVILKERNLI
jgi:multisubunit Na+/H+ antiporter MnhE subunit